MIPQIKGQKAPFNDNNPVECRGYQIQGSALQKALGVYATSPIYYDSSYHWQYFPNGVIISSDNTCACVLLAGPILDLYAQSGQFKGPLGAPATEILTLSDGGTFVRFENGVLFADSNGSAQQLVPLTPNMVQVFAGVDPTASGLAQLAQGIVQSFASNAIQTNQKLKDNVSAVTPTVTFAQTGPGGCAGANCISSPGATLLRSHIFKIHLDISLKGCAGAFGGAEADLTVPMRLRVTPPTISAFLEGFSIDKVGSPFGAGDTDLRNGLTSALNQQFAKDLLGKTLPTGITLLAAIVAVNGDVDIFMEPLCGTGQILARAGDPNSEKALDSIRALRDGYIVKSRAGDDFIRVADTFGPVFTEALRLEPDAARLRKAVGYALTTAFNEDADLRAIAKQLKDPIRKVSRILTLSARGGDPGLVDRYVALGLSFIREHVVRKRELPALIKALSRTLDEEIKRLSRPRRRHHEAD